MGRLLKDILKKITALDFLQELIRLQEDCKQAHYPEHPNNQDNHIQW